MAKKVIDDSNLGYLVSKAKAAFWPKEDVININLADVATSGNYNDLSNKPTIPDVSNFITNSVNNLTNYYLKSETYTKEEVAALIGAIQQFHYEIAASTSAVTSPASNVLYLIGPTGSGADRYEEYVYSSGWVKIGDTSIDLSGYVTTTFLSTELAKYATIASLAAVATSGNYNDLSNKPTIPEDKIFIAEDGVTTYSDILTAYNGGKIIFVKSGNLFYPLIKFDQTSSPNKFVFAIFNPEENSYITASLNSGGGAWVHSMSAPNLFEYAGNKVNSITGNESNTTKYPSTKAVADALSGLNDVKYTAQNLTDAQKAQARTNIGATAPEIFWAEYGVTTVAEIKAQVDAGKAVYLLYASPSMFSIPLIYFLSVSTSQAAMFYSSWLTMYLGIQVSLIGGESVWGEVEMFTPEDSGNKVTSWQNTPDNTHFPSEKLVKDSLDAKQPTIDANHKLDYSLITNTPTIPAAQVNADWEATSGLAEILNKPTIPTTYAGSPTAGGFANKTVAIPFGTVDATSTSTVLTATVDNFPEQLSDGVCAYIRNNAVASASGYTLNINGTGALPVYVSNADDTRSTTIFNASTTFLFVYNSSRVSGGCWDIYYGYNSNDNTIGYNLRTNGASTPPASQKYYRYRLLFTSANGQNLVPANTSSSTSATAAKTVNQTKIDPFGVIFYYSNTSAVNASSSPSASYLWLQYNGIALGYSFNRTGAALTMTTRDPVYLKCTPQSDGSAIMDADNPIVQALPTTADGKIYIFLGYAESATALTLYYWHPVYYHDGTKIAIWSGSSETNADVTFTEENWKYTIPKADIDKLIAGRPKNIKFVTNGSIVSTTLGSGTLSLEFLTLLAYSTDMFFGSNYVGMALMPHTFVVSPDTSDPTDPTKTEVTLGGHKFTYNATSETYEYDTNNPSADDYDDSVEFVINKVTSLSSTSTDVQYPSAKAVYTALSGKQDALTFDTTPTANSTNPVTSGGVYNAITENEEVVAAALNDLNDRLLDIDTSSMTSVTWAELVALRNNSQLKPGHQYRITDYVTKVRWNGCKSAEHPFDIIVTANSTNQLSEIARAMLHSNDNYFDDYEKWPEYTPRLQQWELKYCLDNDVCRFTWAEPGVQYIAINYSSGNTELLAVRNSDYDDSIGSGYYGWEVFTDPSGIGSFMYTLSSSPSTGDFVWDEYEQQIGTVVSFNTPDPGKGVIYYMKDEFNNSAYYDFKNVMFERKYDSYTGQYSTVYSPEYGSSMSIYCYTFNCLTDDGNGGHVSEDGTLICNGNSYYIDGGYNGVRNSKIEPYYEQSAYSPGGGSGGPMLQGQGILTLPNVVVWSTWLDGANVPSMSNLFIDFLVWNFPTYNLQKTITIETENKIYSNRFMATQNLQHNYINKDATHSQLTSALNIYNAIHPEVSTRSSSTGSYSISPNILTTVSGTITGSKTFTLLTPDDSNIANHYYWTFDTGATAPNITWPSGLTWPGGSAPAILPNKHYEISVLNNIVAWMEV